MFSYFFYDFLVFLIFILVIIGLIYYNIERLEFIILFYYSFNYQLEKIYNNTSTNYNEVIFSFIFIYDGISKMMNNDSSYWLNFLIAAVAVFMFFFRRKFSKKS